MSGKVSDAEVAERVQNYAFVPERELPALKAADRWWEEQAQKRRIREGADKAFAWLEPFIPSEAVRLEPFSALMQFGPQHGASRAQKELRALIRERRKSKQPWDDLLQWLYGTSVLAHFAESLSFEGSGTRVLASHVDAQEFNPVRIDYQTIGYQCLETLGKTDIKWLVERFGEPAEHQSFDALWPHIRRNAISRYCWNELRQNNKRSAEYGHAAKTIDQWLSDLVRQNIFGSSGNRVGDF